MTRSKDTLVGLAGVKHEQIMVNGKEINTRG
jgi:hypothetical protein